jgi:hypothetical protein
MLADTIHCKAEMKGDEFYNTLKTASPWFLLLQFTTEDDMLQPSVIMMRMPPTVVSIGVPQAHRWDLIATIVAAGLVWKLCVEHSLVFKGRSITAKFCSWHSSAYLSLCLIVSSTAC